jgi:hypothetical protein
MDTYTVVVGFSLGRPIIPDQFLALVEVQADSGREAQLIASQMVATHSAMPTSTEILSVEI